MQLYIINGWDSVNYHSVPSYEGVSLSLIAKAIPMYITGMHDMSHALVFGEIIAGYFTLRG